MVMKAQAEGLSREVKAKGSDGKAVEYWIYGDKPVFEGRVQLGFTRRVVKGSVSTWEGHSRQADGSFTVFAETDKNHGSLMVKLRDARVEKAGTAADPKSEAPPVEIAAPSGSAPAAPARPRGKSKAARAAEKTQQDAEKLAAAQADPTTTAGGENAEATAASLSVPADGSPSAEGGVVPAEVAATAERPPGTANPEAMADVEAAFQETDTAAAASLEEHAEPVESGDGGNAETVIAVIDPNDGEVVGAAIVEPDGIVVTVGIPDGELQADGTTAAPAAVFDAGLTESGDNPFASDLRDPLRDAFSPAFMPGAPPQA